MHELADQLISILKATWRYRWFAMAIAWLIAAAGWIIVERMPDRYEAWARVYVDTQSMLNPLLSGLADWEVILIGTAVSVAIMSYAAVPLCTKLFSPWLYPKAKT